MKNKSVFWGFLLIIVGTMITAIVGCDTETTNNNNNGDISGLTIDGLQSFGGKFISVNGNSTNIQIIATKNAKQPTDNKISGNAVILPVWDVTDWDNKSSILPPKYTGNDIFSIIVSINDGTKDGETIEKSFESVEFINGNATIEW